MKIKQKSIRSFEIEVDDLIKLKDFIDKRLEQLKNYPIFVKTSNKDIKSYLDGLGIEVFYVSDDFKSSNKKIDIEQKNDIIIEKKEILKPKTEIFNRIIRGGEEIISDSQLIFLKRINSGAKVISTSSIEVFDEIDGYVECNGDYLIIKSFTNGSVIFNGEELKPINELSIVDKNGIKKIT
jgi:septum site-determining protein MinC